MEVMFAALGFYFFGPSEPDAIPSLCIIREDPPRIHRVFKCTSDIMFSGKGPILVAFHVAMSYFIVENY